MKHLATVPSNFRVRAPSKAPFLLDESGVSRLSGGKLLLGSDSHVTHYLGLSLTSTQSHTDVSYMYICQFPYVGFSEQAGVRSNL